MRVPLLSTRARVTLAVLSCLAGFPARLPVRADPVPDDRYRMVAGVLAAGGGPAHDPTSGAAPHYAQAGTLAEAAPIGRSSDPVLALASGFWAGCLDPDRLLATAHGHGSGSDGLRGVRPNPSSSAARISLALSEPRDVELTIFDVTGRRVRLLLVARLGDGGHEVVWDCRDDHGSPVAPGVYFCRARLGTRITTARVLTLR